MALFTTNHESPPMFPFSVMQYTPEVKQELATSENSSQPFYSNYDSNHNLDYNPNFSVSTASYNKKENLSVWKNNHYQRQNFNFPLNSVNFNFPALYKNSSKPNNSGSCYSPHPQANVKKELQCKWQATDSLISNDDTLKHDQFRGKIKDKICGLIFYSLVGLVEHINNDHVRDIKVKDNTCYWLECSRNRKPFKAKYKLIYHVRVHTGEKPYPCLHMNCGKEFSRSENLKIHKRIHTGEKPFSCDFGGCNRRFANSSDKKKHSKTHLSQKPFPCKIDGCEKAYTHPASLRKHMRVHLQDDNSIDPEFPVAEPELKEIQTNDFTYGMTTTLTDSSNSSCGTEIRTVEAFTQNQTVSKFPTSYSALSALSPSSSLYLSNHEIYSPRNKNHHSPDSSASNYYGINCLDKNISDLNQGCWTKETGCNFHEAQRQQKSYPHETHYQSSLGRSDQCHHCQPRHQHFEQDFSYFSDSSFFNQQSNLTSSNELNQGYFYTMYYQ